MKDFWQLPLGKEYSKQIKSDIADIKNIGPRGKAGTIMGAVFIQEFVDKAKWAHLDIAGTAWADSVQAAPGKGADRRRRSARWSNLSRASQ